MEIRKGRQKDANACMKIAKADRAKHWKTEDFSRAAKDRHAIFLVAEDKGLVVGYVNGFIVPTRHTEALLHETRVIRTRRRERIGSELVKRFCREAFLKGADTVSAQIAGKHTKFYCKACGFKKKGNWIEVAIGQDSTT